MEFYTSNADTFIAFKEGVFDNNEIKEHFGDDLPQIVETEDEPNIYVYTFTNCAIDLVPHLIGYSGQVDHLFWNKLISDSGLS